tara:strand:+ start:130 stop:330 length:201 start_codon:yes stop_codon:yes gene_type:complete
LGIFEEYNFISCLFLKCFTNPDTNGKKSSGKTASNWWRGEDLNFPPSGYEPYIIPLKGFDSIGFIL